ncbi:formin-like protein 6 [Triticum aestivum]|uniref:formin-like protein 6 n=1 Tax=Triticum aestivum TaxID=4565 RepID=UPI001D0195BE|nr:formin-like protein 6 [Triticum aestivum]
MDTHPYGRKLQSGPLVPSAPRHTLLCSHIYTDTRSDAHDTVLRYSSRNNFVLPDIYTAYIFRHAAVGVVSLRRALKLGKSPCAICAIPSPDLRSSLTLATSHLVASVVSLTRPRDNPDSWRPPWGHYATKLPRNHGPGETIFFIIGGGAIVSPVALGARHQHVPERPREAARPRRQHRLLRHHHRGVDAISPASVKGSTSARPQRVVVVRLRSARLPLRPLLRTTSVQWPYSSQTMVTLVSDNGHTMHVRWPCLCTSHIEACSVPTPPAIPRALPPFASLPPMPPYSARKCLRLRAQAPVDTAAMAAAANKLLPLTGRSRTPTPRERLHPARATAPSGLYASAPSSSPEACASPTTDAGSCWGPSVASRRHDPPSPRPHARGHASPWPLPGPSASTSNIASRLSNHAPEPAPPRNRLPPHHHPVLGRVRLPASTRPLHAGSGSHAAPRLPRPSPHRPQAGSPAGSASVRGRVLCSRRVVLPFTTIAPPRPRPSSPPVCAGSPRRSASRLQPASCAGRLRQRPGLPAPPQPGRRHLARPGRWLPPPPAPTGS